MGWPAEQCLFPRPELGACGPMNDTREPTRADGSVALYPEAGRAGDTIHVACRNARPWKPAADLVVGFESHHHIPLCSIDNRPSPNQGRRLF